MRAVVRLLLTFCLIGLAPCASAAQERVLLGWGGIATNDVWGDGQDRWRTGSYSLSVAVGPGWNGAPPARPGELLEFQFHAEIAAPSRLDRPWPGDRPYAGVLSFGLFTHFSASPGEAAVGAEAVIVGPQTRLHDLHTVFHDLVGGSDAPAPEDQIGNGVYPTVSGEYAIPMAAFDGRVRFRPFVRMQAGYETYARAGADLTIGRAGLGELMVRERVSGLHHPVVTDPEAGGLSLTLGGDIAHLWDSRLLPGSRGYRLTDARWRLRAGVTYDAGPAWVFFGTAWLGREFERQEQGQRIGVVTANIRF